MSGTVAVIDVGSNSIKLLVAAAGPAGTLDVRLSATEETRIGGGLGSGRPALAPEAIEAAVAAVGRLLAAAAPHRPQRIAMVATSAVRDAANGAEFVTRVQAATGLTPRVLGGEEEARLIGRGLATDPALSGATDFRVLDLGGGSLEVLEFRGGETRVALSLPLGCVRLTERLVANPAGPLTTIDRTTVAEEVRRHLVAALPAPLEPLPVVATGGTVVTARAILAAAEGLPLEERRPVIGTEELEAVLSRVAPRPLAERRLVPGLPGARADVFPAAVATILAALAHLGADRLVHSFHNLRYGLAAELLES